MLKPMLATAGTVRTRVPGLVIEPKLDGVRAIVRVHRGDLQIHSRNGHDVTDCYPEIGRLPACLAGVSAVFDGEIVALGSGGLPDFQLLQQRMNRRRPTAAHVAAVPVALFVFDVLWLDGQDLTNLPLRERRARLQNFTFDDSWQLVPRLDVHLTDEVVDSFLHAGLEGVIVKSDGSIYRPGERTTSWIKIKARHHSRAVICGFLKEKARGSIGSLSVGMYDPAGRLRYVGQIANSLKHAEADSLDRFLRSTVVAVSPYADLDSDALIYVVPHVVVEVAFTEVTNAGTFRQPILRSVLVGTAPAEAVAGPEFVIAIARRTSVTVGGGQRL